MMRGLTATIALIILVSLGIPAASVTRTYSDGDYLNWRSHFAGWGDAYYTRYETGGAPGAYVACTTISGNAFLCMMNGDAAWTGRVDSVTMRIDVRRMHDWDCQALGVLALQNGTYYAAKWSYWGGYVTGICDTWTTVQLSYRQADFSILDPWLWTDPPPASPPPGSEPDFSAAGAPVVWGFWVGNTGSYVITQIYDNWQLTVDGAPVPEPSCLLALLAGTLGFIARSRRR